MAATQESTNVPVQPRQEGTQPSPLSPGSIDYIRRMYDMALDWYKTAERKAQLLLTVHGAFAAILLGLIANSLDELRNFRHVAGVETWLFLVAAVVMMCSAIGLAAASLLSRHSHNIKSDFGRLGIDRDDPRTYTAEVTWYYGHVASLQFLAAVDLLRTADQRMELNALTYNAVGLSHVVLRKHRLINLGWQVTAAALLAAVAAGVSLFVRGQL